MTIFCSYLLISGLGFPITLLLLLKHKKRYKAMYEKFQSEEIKTVQSLLDDPEGKEL